MAMEHPRNQWSFCSWENHRTKWGIAFQWPRLRRQTRGTCGSAGHARKTHHRQQTMEWIGIEQLQCKYYTCVTTITYSNNSIPIMSIPIPNLILQVMSIPIVICVQLIYDGSWWFICDDTSWPSGSSGVNHVITLAPYDYASRTGTTLQETLLLGN